MISSFYLFNHWPPALPKTVRKRPAKNICKAWQKEDLTRSIWAMDFLILKTKADNNLSVFCTARCWHIKAWRLKTLKRHLETEHHSLKSKPVEYFRRQLQDLMTSQKCLLHALGNNRHSVPLTRWHIVLWSYKSITSLQRTSSSMQLWSERFCINPQLIN